MLFSILRNVLHCLDILPWFTLTAVRISECLLFHAVFELWFKNASRPSFPKNGC
jgi:hypothetical protein